MELSKRLKRISDFIETGDTLVDIGCDHGYLCIYSVENNIVKKAIGSDVRKGPLSKARENISFHKLEDKIETRLGNGLEKINKYEGSALAIAGMGGLLTISIINDNIEVVRTFKELILSPQSDICEVRKYLLSNNFYIEKEDFILDKGKYYNIFRVVNRVENKPYKEVELKYGRDLLQNRNITLLEYLSKEEEKITCIYDSLYRNNIKESNRLSELEEELALIKEAKNYYEGL